MKKMLMLIISLTKRMGEVHDVKTRVFENKFENTIYIKRYILETLL